MAIPEQALSAVRSGAASEEEFEALVERQTRFVFRVAYAMLRNVHDAEDVVQETFLRVHRANAWSRMDDERAFLARIAWRLSVDRLPRRRPAELSEDTAAAGQDPEQSAIRADLSRAVERLVDALPEELRQPLALSAIEELSSARIAETMGIPEGTVRTRLMRARRLLKEKLSARKEGGHAR